MIRFNFLIAAVSATAFNAAPQTAVQVVDAGSGDPVEFACVSNPSHTIGFMADAEGRFDFDASDFSGDSIVISRIGYCSRAFSADELPATVSLQQSPNTLQSVVVVPKKRKDMGSMFIPNAVQKAALTSFRKSTSPTSTITESRAKSAENSSSRRTLASTKSASASTATTTAASCSMSTARSATTGSESTTGP